MSQITEWEFTADVASQINEILKERPELPFSEARCEQRKTGQIKRRDLTLLNAAKKPVFTGEVKMPDKRDGRSPLNETAVIDAHYKANEIGVKHFFTWNVNDCVLWNTFEEGKSIVERHIEFIKALPAPVAKSDELLQPRVKEQIRDFLEKLLERCADVISGKKPLEKRPPDETFIKVWEVSLSPLVTDTLREISFRYEHNKQFHKNIDEWMRVGLGLNLSQKDELIIRQNLLDTAKQSCFVLANKIIFYKALRQKFNELPDIEINSHFVNDFELHQLFQSSFEKVKKITGDYETVFEMNFGDSLTLLSQNSSELSTSEQPARAANFGITCRFFDAEILFGRWRLNIAMSFR